MLVFSVCICILEGVYHFLCLNILSLHRCFCSFWEHISSFFIFYFIFIFFLISYLLNLIDFFNSLFFKVLNNFFFFISRPVHVFSSSVSKVSDNFLV